MFITRPRIFGVALALVTPPAVAGSGSGWVLETVPTSEVLNGVSAPSLDYAMAVGNNGTIVLFENGDTGTLMVSGTSKDLLDVYASSPNLAVAAGIDTVLLWDGMSWDEIRNTTDGTLFTGTWISPEEDVVLYGILGASFDFVCPYFPAMPDPPPFCRTFGRALLAACGHSDDIKVITEDGDVYRVDNFLGDIDATNPIHEEPGLLGLTAVYAPQLSCLSGAVPPRSMFAIRQSGEIWHFDGDNWTDMNVPIPASQTLTAISGTGPGLVVASGFEPNPAGGNDGVIWLFNGNSWTQENGLRAGSAGMVDVSANIERDSDFIFAGDFDTATIPASAGLLSRIRAVGEEGQLLTNEVLAPSPVSDLSASLLLNTPEPHVFGQRLVYDLLIKNEGGQTLMNIDFQIGTDARDLTYVSNDCGLGNLSNSSTWVEWGRPIAVLEPGAAFPCTVSYDIATQSATGFITARVVAFNIDDYDPLNNTYSVAIQANQTPAP